MTVESFLDGRVVLHLGDSRERLRDIPDNSIDSCVCDPPYALVSIVERFGKEGAAPVDAGKHGAYARASAGFMGKAWDTGETAFTVNFWSEVLRVLKPGAHLVAFGGTRTYHRLACAIEDAGFEIRDQLAWVYGSGFPKSHNVALGIDKAAGQPSRGKAFNMKGRGDRAEELDANGREFPPPYEAATDAARNWQGWGTALKPAWEPIVLARKPLGERTVAANVLQHGTGAINVDGCRVPTDDSLGGGMVSMGRPKASEGWDRPWMHDKETTDRKKVEAAEKVAVAESLGRWPANLIHDGSPEVLAAFPDAGGGFGKQHERHDGATWEAGSGFKNDGREFGYGDAGSAARFFYTAKADADDRLGFKHPTIKPVDLMQWLVRLVTPKGGLVLDPFAGTGTTGEAAWREGMRAILIEREEEYQGYIRDRMGLLLGSKRERRMAHVKGKAKVQTAGPLFGDS